MLLQQTIRSRMQQTIIHTSDIFDVLVNRKGGTVLKAGEDRVVQDIRGTLGAKARDIRLIEGKDIIASVQQWQAQNAGSGRSLLIGGGDGSLLTAAEQVMGSATALGTLPLGTQNFLALTLGLSPDYKEALKQYAQGPLNVRRFDVGNVNGMPFLYGILLDKNCVRFFEAREHLREKQYAGFLSGAFAASAGVMAGRKMVLHVAENPNGEGQTIEARVFAIANNAFAPQPAKPGLLRSKDMKDFAAKAFAKGESSNGSLVLYGYRGGALRLPRSFHGLLNGTWDKQSAVTTRIATELHISAAGKNGDGHDAKIILDGEIKTTHYPLHVKIIPGGVNLYQCR